MTTTVIGNCGFGVAPTKAIHRKLIMQTLEKVEGMSLDALYAGLGDDWPFETFPQYLDALEKRGSAINVAALFGHTPLRMYVMGEEFDRTRRHGRRDRRHEEADARGHGGRRHRLRHLGVGQP